MSPYLAALVAIVEVAVILYAVRRWGLRGMWRGMRIGIERIIDGPASPTPEPVERPSDLHVLADDLSVPIADIIAAAERVAEGRPVREPQPPPPPPPTLVEINRASRERYERDMARLRRAEVVALERQAKMHAENARSLQQRIDEALAATTRPDYVVNKYDALHIDSLTEWRDQALANRDRILDKIGDLNLAG